MVAGEPVRTYTDAELGVPWVTLEEQRRDDLELRFFGLILSCLAGCDQATFSADIPLPQEREPVRQAASAAGLELREERGVLSGSLTPSLADALTRVNSVVLAVLVHGIVRYRHHDGWTGAVAYLTNEEAVRLRGCIEARAVALV